MSGDEVDGKTRGRLHGVSSKTFLKSGWRLLYLYYTTNQMELYHCQWIPEIPMQAYPKQFFG